MADKSKIEWTEATWNPIRGCSRVSDGCRNCYAERVAMRFSGPGKPYEGLVKMANGHPQWTGKVQFVENHLADPLKWREPRRVFVNSMSDLFHDGLSVEEIDKIFAIMALCHQHTFQILTKRPARMLEYMRNIQDDDKDMHRWAAWACEISNSPCAAGVIEDIDWPPKNIWLGVSCENQATADERIPLLLQTPAAVRWISAEPLLSSIDMTQLPITGRPLMKNNALTGKYIAGMFSEGGHAKLDWVVAGGESGPKARPMHPDWARSLRDQCQAAGVPFFFKQWGEHVFDERAADQSNVPEELRDVVSHRGVFRKVGKKAAGRLLDGKEHSEYPEAR